MVYFATGEKCEVPPNSFTRSKQLVDFPDGQALFFSNILECVITHILGWSRKKRSPTIQLGMFPLVNAWAYAIENDGAQTLHCHMLVWCLGESHIQKQINHYLCVSNNKIILTIRT